MRNTIGALSPDCRNVVCKLDFLEVIHMDNNERPGSDYVPDTPQHHGYEDNSHRPTTPQRHGYRNGAGHRSTLPQHHGYRDNSHSPSTPRRHGYRG